MKNDLLRVVVGFSAGLASCLLGEGETLVGLVVLPASIFALHALDPRRPLLVPVAVALGRLCRILPLIPVAVAPGGLESVAAALVVGPALAYWLLLLWLYGLAGYLGCGWGCAAVGPLLPAADL